MGVSHDPGLCSPVLYWNLILKHNRVPIFSFCDRFCRPLNYNSFPQGAMMSGLGMDRSDPGAHDIASTKKNTQKKQPLGLHSLPPLSL